MIKKLFGLVFNLWVLLALLVVLLLLVIWWVGPAVSVGDWRPLDSTTERWIVTAVVLVLVALGVGWRVWRARRGNRQIVQHLVAAPAGPAAASESADMKAVRERFETALVTLRKARFGVGAGDAATRKPGLLSRWTQALTGRFLYELPWYTIIGAPGSGKTTALRNAGLRFPLADQMGGQAVRGVGGTRNCDSWFTDQAVLIDTAGRFTTQDSDAGNDKATWAAFLQLLKKSRPRQPLNGVLVTVSVADLIARSPGERATHAQAVRARVQELHEQLGLRFPIYLLVTKCDLLSGFAESFAALDKDQRATPWGFTVPIKGPSAQQSLSAEFDALLARLDQGLVDALQAEADPHRRARIYGFPNQFAHLRDSLNDFASQVFSPSPFEADPMLRGVYFISGTQEGSPIDRVLGAVSRRYKLEQAMLPAQQSSGRSFFLSRLLTEVVFAEQGLAGTQRGVERRRGALAVAGYAVIGLLVIGLGAAWGISWSNNKAYIDAVAARVELVRKGVNETPNRASADLRPVLPALSATRGLAAAGASNDKATGAADGRVPLSLGFGLYQGRKLDGAARTAYERMLVDAVMPRLALRVEEQLRAGDQPESQYEALKAYLMMYEPERFEPAALKAHIESDWDVRLARELSTEQREAMTAHLDALLAQGATVSPIPQDKALVDALRVRLSAVPLQQRVYNRLRQRGLGSDFPEFTIAKAGGGNAALVFVRASGAPLTKGVPGLFSYKGYHDGFQSVVSAATQQLSDEQGWVLGIPASEAKGSQMLTASQKLTDDVRRLYLIEYRDTWKEFIKDIRLQPMTSVSQSLEKARFLAAPDTPLVPLLKAMSRETTLLAGKGVVESAEQSARRAAGALQSKVLGALGTRTATTGAPAERIESIVDNEFESLRRLVTAPEGGKAPIDGVIARLAELQVLLTAVDSALKGGAAPPPSPLPNQIKAEAANSPEPVRSILENLGTTSSRVALMQLRESLSREVRAMVGEFCNQAIAGRYPFSKSATLDVAQADFAALFGPGGRFEQMMTKLAPYVDQSTRPSWTFRAVDGTPLGTDVGTLPQFQRAQIIRETFFSAGGNTPSTRVEMRPVEMDAGIKAFSLDVDGQVVRYAHGPQIPAPVTWPGPRGTNVVRLLIEPSSINGMSTEGSWALFKLFDRVSFVPGGEREKYRAVFDLDGKKAAFDITASSVRNPFRLDALSSFSCPQGL